MAKTASDVMIECLMDWGVEFINPSARILLL